MRLLQTSVIMKIISLHRIYDDDAWKSETYNKRRGTYWTSIIWSRDKEIEKLIRNLKLIEDRLTSFSIEIKELS